MIIGYVDMFNIVTGYLHPYVPVFPAVCSWILLSVSPCAQSYIICLAVSESIKLLRELSVKV
jgi:hypothetical protein